MYGEKSDDLQSEENTFILFLTLTFSKVECSLNPGRPCSGTEPACDVRRHKNRHDAAQRHERDAIGPRKIAQIQRGPKDPAFSTRTQTRW